MTQHDVLTAVAGALTDLNGHAYAVDYFPFRNISEQNRLPVRYTVSPGRGKKEKINRAGLRNVQEVVIQHFETVAGDPTEAVCRNQDEIEAIERLFMLDGGPIAVVYCKAAESEPPIDSGVDLSGLGDSPATLTAILNLTLEY